MKIAVAEDNSTNLNSLIEKFSKFADVELLFTAINGKDFLDKLKASSSKPDVVLMDIDMPLMNGIETVRAGRQLDPDICFLMLTVFDDDEKIFEAIKAGAVGYLLKDEPATKILESCREVIEFGGSPMSPRIARKALQIISQASTSKKEKDSTDALSSREIEILQNLVDGKDYREIAEQLFLSPNTVRTHIANIYKKLQVNNKAQAAKVAFSKGWFSIF
jgi:DNA-binding NarL/FixJ family response regulator